jgi:hypothetical protein
MVDEKNKMINEAGETSFGGPVLGSGNWFTPLGSAGRWFAKFFASASKPYITKQGEDQPYAKSGKAGDTFTSTDTVKVKTAQTYDGPELVVRTVLIPEYERSRKERYRQFESMDEYPEISSAFDVYADDATQRNIQGKRWVIKSSSEIVKDEVERLFKTIDLERFYWDIIRNIVKFGDCFVEIIIDENNQKSGIQRIKILNPNFIIRVENMYGYLTAFLQEIPKTIDWSSFGSQSDSMSRNNYITLDKNQIIHFRLHTSDPRFYPYGRGVAGGVIRAFRSLKLMEDAMLVYRLSRAPERRVFYINTGNIPSHRVATFVDQMKQKLRKEKFFNSSTGNIDERFNPLSVDEDLFIPHRGDKETRVDVLPGAQNLGDIDDVKYFLDKVLGGMKVPRDYIVESKDKGAERKANLSQLDVKFGRTVARVQHQFTFGLQAMVRRHLKIKGFPQSLINEFRIEMPDPTDMFTKRKLEIDEAKTRVVTAVLGSGLFSKKTVYKEYYEMSPDEIETELAQIDEEQQEEFMKQQQQAMEQQMMMQPEMGGGMPQEGAEMPPESSESGLPGVGGRSGLIAQQQPGSAGMDSPQNETIQFLDKVLLNESDVKKIKAFNSIKEKLKNFSKIEDI